MRKTLSGLIFLALLPVGGSNAGDVGVNLNINIGHPAPIIVQEPPLFLVPARLGFGVAVGVGYDMFHVNARYYQRHGNFWYVANGYNGPWTVIVVDRLPPGLRKHKLEKIRYYRDQEYKKYNKGKSEYRGRSHRPEREDDDRGRGRGRGRGND